jgi:hypothetical protein
MPERDCSGCTKQREWGCNAHRVASNEDDPEALRGEDGKWWKWVNPADLPIAFDGEKDWYACPRQHIRRNPDYWRRILLFYGHYQNGYLPQKGAIIDQSNKAMVIFAMVEAANGLADSVGQETTPEPERKKGNPFAPS